MIRWNKILINRSNKITKIKKSKNAIPTIEQKVDSINIINLQEQFSEQGLGQGDSVVLELFDIVNKKVKKFLN